MKYLRIRFIALIVICLGLHIGPGYAAGQRDSDRVSFYDDDQKDSLLKAIGESIRYYRLLPAGRELKVCGAVYSAARLARSLETFASMVEEDMTPQEFDRRLHEQFVICQAQGGPETGRMLVTGYYEPLYEASLTKKTPYLYPLYKVPPDLAVVVGGSKFSGKKVGRLTSNGFSPYWPRAEIESKNVLAGHELVYLKDPVEAFIIHVQGSGRVRLPNGETKRVQFAAKNGLPYRSIGRLLVDEGVMSLEEVNMPRIIQYLKANPDLRERILNHNESYVFFRWGDDAHPGPIGSLGRPLTAGRSVALDDSLYPPGGLAYLITQKPLTNRSGDVVAWQPLQRFVLNQDSGSAIKGGGRIDFFYGSGKYAETAAGFMKQPGELYFLVRKK